MLEKILKNTRRIGLIGTLIFAPLTSASLCEPDSNPDASSYEDASNPDAGYTDAPSGYVSDAGKPDVTTNYQLDAGMNGLDALVEDAPFTRDADSFEAAVSDYGIDASVAEAGIPDVSYTDAGEQCPSINEAPDLTLQRGVTYCTNFSDNNLGIPSGCGVSIPWAPGHSSNGMRNYTNCGSNVVTYTLELVKGDPFLTSINNNGKFLLIMDDRGSFDSQISIEIVGRKDTKTYHTNVN